MADTTVDSRYRYTNPSYNVLPKKNFSNDSNENNINLFSLATFFEYIISLYRIVEGLRIQVNDLELELQKKNKVQFSEQENIIFSNPRSSFLQELKGQYDDREQKLMIYYYDAFLSHMMTVYQASQLISSHQIAPNISFFKNILPLGHSVLEGFFSLSELIPVVGPFIGASKKVVDGLLEVKAINKASAIAHMVENDNDFKEITHKLARYFAFSKEEKILYKDVKTEESQSWYSKITSPFSNIWNNISEIFLSKIPIQSDFQEIESLAKNDVEKFLELVSSDKSLVDNNLNNFSGSALNNVDDQAIPLLAQVSSLG